ncbi:innexin inx7 isoform X2 [Topomyia yanbarensis]|uniref:innexin inx7 isoform X2 n=1 Tax=Topomyia yanbarensis TaxID=2498891 RepID=UPI00273A7619|nr:innexin inx7 isoform X2 [Topomyia yanbarensis]
MLNTFSVLSPHLKFKNKFVSIDNLAFKFHYRATFTLLLVCTLLVTSRQYIGEHIRCITGGSIPEHVINTFCFFTTTFTVVRLFNESMLQAGSIPHPGVGHMSTEEPVKHHAYYQWVPFVLFLQAIMFYGPHYLWRTLEGGKIKRLVDGLKMVEISNFYERNNSITFETKYTLRSKFELNKKLDIARDAFHKHILINQLWAFKLVFCETLNLLNVLTQVWFTNKFLSGRFYHLGLDFIEEDFTGTMDVLDTVFPKVTKCHFHKYGPSGTIQKHDALCVMALNVINEKIFTFLWFWYAIVIIVSISALIWRLITLWQHSRSMRFNEFVFSFAYPGILITNDMQVITKSFSFSDWLFLYHLARNMDQPLFKTLFRGIIHRFNDRSDTLSAKLMDAEFAASVIIDEKL